MVHAKAPTATKHKRRAAVRLSHVNEKIDLVLVQKPGYVHFTDCSQLIHDLIRIVLDQVLRPCAKTTMSFVCCSNDYNNDYINDQRTTTTATATTT